MQEVLDSPGVSLKKHATDRYEAVGRPFCDGMEVDLGPITREVYQEGEAVLKNALNRAVPEIVIKHLGCSVRSGRAYLWITVDPSSAALTPRSMQQARDIVKTIREHAEECHWIDDWEDEDEEREEADGAICLSKYDITVDHRGAFIPSDYHKTRAHLQMLLGKALNENVFGNNPSNFLTRGVLGGLRVVKGRNSLASCH